MLIRGEDKLGAAGRDDAAWDNMPMSLALVAAGNASA